MTTLALSALVAQSDGPAAAADFSSEGQAITLVLVVIVIAAMALALSAAGVLWGLIEELLGGLWASLKVLALLAVVLVCLLYLFVHGLR